MPPPDAGTGDATDPGVFEAVGGVKAALLRMLRAHIGLLKAELAITGRELGIIIGLAAAALFLAFVTALLLYIGWFLFMGEWLFGSMGWGMLHGTLMAAAIIGFVVVDLAGGSKRSYGWGFLWGVVVTIGLGLFFASNLLRQGAVSGAQSLESTVALHPNLLPTLVGLVVGAIVAAIALLLAGWRMRWRFGSPVGLTVAGLIVGGFFGAILGSAVFDNPGAFAMSLTLGLLTWIVVGLGLAARKGFDPASRYASLVPRESVAAFESTRDFMTRQWQRQKRRFLGR